jgi:hypothetical protein
MQVAPRDIQGIVGRLEWGYFVAAAINNYRLRQTSDGGWHVSATVVKFDAFKIRQKPLIFCVPHKDGEWRWPIRTIDLGEGHGPRHMIATLGQRLPEMFALRSGH